MRSDSIQIKSSGEGVEEALYAASASAVYRALNKKEAIHLRLLAEETIGLARQLTDAAGATFWVESTGRAFELHLIARPLVTGSMRRELLKVSTSGKNEAAKGFTGKLRDIVNRAVAPESANGAADYYSRGLIPPDGYTLADPLAYSMSADAVTWSMRKYRDEVGAHAADSAQAKEEWDELEKSIVASIADEVKIAVTGDKVEMTVYKSF